jgi:crossover junction endodeoxyribonuclease RuvC
MNVLALDLGTHLGWAMKKDGKVSFGTKVFRRDPTESVGAILHHFRMWMNSRLDEFTPDVIVYEYPHLRGKHATTLLVGMSAILAEISHIRKIPVVAVHSQTLKKGFCGSGRASKEEMIEQAKKVVKSRRKLSSHEADAIALLCYVEGRSK